MTDTSLYDNRRKRLYYQCTHRGMKELDVILGQFAEQHLASMTDDELTALEKLLDTPEADLWGWLLEEEASGENTGIQKILTHLRHQHP